MGDLGRGVDGEKDITGETQRQRERDLFQGSGKQIFVWLIDGAQIRTLMLCTEFDRQDRKVSHTYHGLCGEFEAASIYQSATCKACQY